jgi:deoxyribonuclease V
VHRGELVGAALRTRSNARPIFVSVGNRVSLTTAVEYVLRLSPRYRVPEPIRQADRLSRMHLADRI